MKCQFQIQLMGCSGRWRGKMSWAGLMLAFLAGMVQAQDLVRNPGFEEGAAGEEPAGWQVGHGGMFDAFSVSLTREGCRGQEQCLQLRRAKGGFQGQALVQQSIDAAELRGKRIRLRAAVRADVGPYGQARLFLREVRPQGKRGFADEMLRRPIQSAEWQVYELIGDVHPDALQIWLGARLERAGKCWVDDFSLQVMGDAQPELAEASRPLTPAGLQNLVAFTKLLGYVRHFHPSDQAAGVDWHRLALEGVRTVEPAANQAELISQLEALFQPIAPTVRLTSGRDPPSPSSDLLPPPGPQELWLVSWRHLGYGQSGNGGIYSSQRERKALGPDESAAKLYPSESLFFAELGAGLSALVPLALYADKEGTLPRAKAVEEAWTGVFYTAQDRAARLAAVSLAWNVFQHFYPYFDVVDADWEAILKSSLQSAAVDSGEDDFLITLERMVAALEDGHGRVIPPRNWRTHSLPLAWDWIEGHLTVTGVDSNHAPELQVGDVVLSLDGTPAAQALDARMSLCSGTSQWRRYRALGQLRSGPPGSSVDLLLETAGGRPHSLTLKRTIHLAEAPEEPRPDKVSEIRPGILYLDLTRLNDQEFLQALPRMAQAEGLIFDLRGYPRLQPLFLQHLTEKNIQSARWNVPVITRPDRQGWSFNKSNWDLKPLEPYLAAPRAFLTDGRAISYAESCLGIVEHYKLAEIVGAATAGANGNVNPITLPGGYQIMWTGMRVIKHDGSQHHKVGILPTVPWQRTLQGVRQGRDEVLEKAIETLQRR